MKGKILIVDDDADIRRAFRRNLESDTLQIFEAADGPSAIHQVAATQPDLVVMDIRMGATNGLDTLRMIVTGEKVEAPKPARRRLQDDLPRAMRIKGRPK